MREVGRELGLPAELLERHPFPGPGLAVRCLCAASAEPVAETAEGWLLPVRSVGVQGDCRSYAHVLCLDRFPSPEANLQQAATELINRFPASTGSWRASAARLLFPRCGSSESSLSAERLDRLGAPMPSCAVFLTSSGFDRSVWQFPVILIPLGRPERRIRSCCGRWIRWTE